jgi:hypothetical protein
MCDAALFELVEFVAKRVRLGRTGCFGALRLILTGDFYQLPPVPNRDPRHPDLPRESPFCFQRYVSSFDYFLAPYRRIYYARSHIC